MMKIRIFVFLVAVGLNSCGKKTEIKGRVYSDNNIPIPYAGVGILQEKDKSYSYSEKTQADADGYFHFTFRGKRFGNIRYMAQSRNATGITNAYPVQLGKVNEFDLRP